MLLGGSTMKAKRSLQFAFVTWSLALLVVSVAMPRFSPESAEGPDQIGLQTDIGSIAPNQLALSATAMAAKQASFEMTRRSRASRPGSAILAVSFSRTITTI